MKMIRIMAKGVLILGSRRAVTDGGCCRGSRGQGDAANDA